MRREATSPRTHGRSFGSSCVMYSGDGPQDEIVLSIIQPTITSPKFASRSVQHARGYRAFYGAAKAGDALGALETVEERNMRSPAGREPADERGDGDTHRPVVWQSGASITARWDRQVATYPSLLLRSNCHANVPARSTCSAPGESAVATRLGGCAPICYARHVASRAA
jgi:hypothetical protein